ncbi:MAG: hypothetical protein KDJ37_12795 [Hyphomicrobiaceae bacterium]|nr:hypothetical protein [Hyphomicrobiaceae bacterium]
MASNLSSIGFSFDDEDAFRETLTDLANTARDRLTGDTGEYAIWRSRSGAEIWFHLGAEDHPGASPGERVILGLTPFYEGQSAIPLCVTEAIRRPDDNPLEGMLHGWVSPDAAVMSADHRPAGDENLDDIGLGSYPIVFDAVDFAAHAERELPAVWTCRIAAFCREIVVHTQGEFSSQISPGLPLAAQALIPIGLISDEDDEDDEEDAAPRGGVAMPTVLLTGIVRAHRRLDNEITGRAYYWLSVESLEATFDVIADPDIVTGEITDGATVEAVAWLFGRVLD